MLPAQELPPGFQALDGAPKNGRQLILAIPLGGDHAPDDNPTGYAVTIGHNNFDNDGNDVWKYVGWCWTHDHYVHIEVDESGSKPGNNPAPIGYAEMPSAPEFGQLLADKVKKEETNRALRTKLDAVMKADQNIDGPIEYRTIDHGRFITEACKNLLTSFHNFPDEVKSQIAKNIYRWTAGHTWVQGVIFRFVRDYYPGRVDDVYKEITRMKDVVEASWNAFGEDVAHPTSTACVVFEPLPDMSQNEVAQRIFR